MACLGLGKKNKLGGSLPSCGKAKLYHIMKH